MAGPYIRRSGKLGRSAWAFLAALITAVVLLAAACSSPPRAPTPVGSATIAASTEPTKEGIPPDTPAGAQLRWLVAAMSHLSMSEAQVRANFDAGHLAVVGPDALNQVLEAAGIRGWFAEPIDVLGVSTGGSVALQLAADHPGVVRRLVLVSSACRLGPHERRGAAYGAGLFRETAEGLRTQLLLYSRTGHAGAQARRRFVPDVLRFLS